MSFSYNNKLFFSKHDILFSENALGNTQETLMSKFLDNTDYRNLLDKNTDTAKRKLTNIIKNALEAAIDENIVIRPENYSI